MPRPYVLAETTWKLVSAAKFDVAILPWGATEAHNYHLPYGTDVYECDYFAAESARLASADGARVVALPTIPFGVNTGQLDIPLCINMNPSTQAMVLRDVVSSLDQQGIHKLLILNGHGGNDFRQIIRELQPTTRVFLCAVNWWQIVDGREYFDDLGDHGGELETSVMLHCHPELVRPLEEAGDGSARRPKITAMREGWAWSPRKWTQVTADTGIGNPKAATADKGARYASAVTSKLAELLKELARVDPSDLYS
jgi:creatinine amidohydrolase